MAYADPSFEQHRAQILKGAKATTKSAGGSTVSKSVVADPSFTQHRQQVLSAPSAPIKKVSTTPIAKPAVQQQPSFMQNVQSGGAKLLSQAGDFTADAIKKTMGLFTPKGGKPEPIHNEKSFVSPVPVLTPEQQKAVGTLKVGQKIPNYKSSAQSTFDNVIDTIFTKPAKFVLDDTGPLGNSIKKFATQLYNDPVATLNPSVKNIQNLDPKLKKSMRDNPVYKAETAALQGVMQGALRVYANWNPKVESFLDKQVESIGTKSDSEIAGNTVGNIIGTIGSFVAGGEVVAALKLGKIALPATFAALGQTSLPASTPIEARARNLIVDTVAGTLLEYIKPLANLEKMGMFQKTAAYTKQLSKSMAVLGSQTYLDARSVGATDEQAKEMVQSSVLILLGLHGFMIAGKAGSYATRSKFQEGSGTFTPEQARSIVVGSNLENTNLGNQIVKASLEAEAMGKNLKIDMTAAKKSKIAGVLNLQTPNGVKITNIEYVDGTPRVGEVPVGAKPGSPEGSPTGPKSPVLTTEPAPATPNPQKIILYRGGEKEGKSFSTSKVIAEDFAKNRGGNVSEYELKPEAKTIKYLDIPNAKFKYINDDALDAMPDKLDFMEGKLEQDYAEASKWAQENGYDAIEFPTEGEIRILNPKVLQANEAAKKDSATYDYQSTQLNLPAETASKITALAKTIPEEKLSIDEADNRFGIEKEPHITILYGLDNKITADQITEVVGDIGPITVQMGKTSLFENDDYDVLKVDIQSEQLQAINKKLSESFDAPGNTFKDYKPHATIAYLKKGEGAAYVGNTSLEGEKITLDTLSFSTNDGSKIEIPLTGASKPSAPTKSNSPVEPSKAQDLHHPAPDGRGVTKKGIVQAGNSYADLNGVPPNTQVTVFRGVKSSQNGKLKGGEWVTPDKELANLYARNRARASGEDARIIMQKVEAKDLIIHESTNPGVTDEFIYRPQEELTLSPTEATTPEEILAEVKKLGLPESVIKNTFKVGSSGTRISGYVRPEIGKTEFKTFVANSDEFKANPVLTVDGNKDLVFDGEKFKFRIPAESMQLNVDALKPGDTIRIDTKALTGKLQQMRIRNSRGETLGFNPKNLEEPLSPKATEEVKKIVKQSEIAEALSKKLGVPIRRGKFRLPGAIGVYKFGPKVVRIKSGGLGTIFHEVAHYLDDTIGLSKLVPKDEWKTLMSEYGHSYEGQPDKQRMEAFAEYMRFRMTGQTEKIAQWGPKFDAIFREKLASMPDVESVIETATQDYKRWAEQPATSKILSQISIGGQKKPGIRDRAIQGIHDLYTSALDDLHPLAEFSKIAKKNVKNLKATEDPYILARNLRGWVGKADLFLNKGTFNKQFWTPDKKGRARMEFTGKSYSEIMQQVEKMNALDDFRVFIVAERIVNDLADRKIKTGISVEDAKTALKELGEKYPDFERISKERREYKDALLNYAKESGLIGEGGLAKMKELNKYHVPFYRVMEETGTKFLGKTKIAGNISSPIKKIKGSEREIIDPLESDVKDTYALINASERNNIGVAMANISKMNFELGRLFEEVARPMAPVKVNVKEVMDKSLKGTDLEDLEIPDELAEIVVTLFRPTYASGPNMLNVNMGDKQKVFEVDSDLFKAIQGLNVEDVGLIMKLIAIPAKVLRAGATLSPDFSVRNPLRDQFTAFVYSKYGFTPGIDLMRGMFELFRKGDVYDLWKAAGGEHATFVSLDREVLQKNLKQVLSGKGEGGLSYVKNPLKILQILSELGEAGTRLGEMRNALAKGADPVEAAFASRNITLDFARIGAKTKAMNSIIAFLNAQLQSTDTTIRRFKDRPFQTLWKVLVGITLPSVLLYFANRDDKRWKEIPQWQKDLFWIVLTPDNIYRIPKPFELGVIFGSGPERALEAMDTKDPEMFKQLNQTIMDGFTPGWMPTGMIPIVENLSNYSFFLDRPIVSPGKENLPPSQQAGPYTTEVSKVLGEALNYSPAKIDNLVSGYGGGLGKYAQQGIDKILIGTGVVQVPPKPAKKLEEMPVIKAFMIREPIGSGSESVNRVYTKYNAANQQLTYVKQLIKTGKPDEATAYVKKHPETIDAIILTNVVNTFSDMNKAVDTIKQSEKLSPQEKRKKIDQIGILQTNLAQKTLQELKTRKK